MARKRDQVGWIEGEKRLAVSPAPSPDLSPPFLTPHTAILEPDFQNRVFPNPVGDGDLSSSFRCRRCELGPLMGQISSLGMHQLVHTVVSNPGMQWMPPGRFGLFRDGGWVKKRTTRIFPVQGPREGYGRKTPLANS